VPALIGLLFAYILGRTAFIFAGLINDGHLMFRIGSLLRRNMLARILGLPGARVLKESPGEAISRFREDVEYTEETVSWTVDLIGAFLFSAMAFAVLVTVDVVITVLVFLPLVVVILVVERAGSRIRRYRDAARGATERITGAIEELFGAAQAVKVAGAEADMIARFRLLNDERRRMMVRDRGLNALLESVFWNTVSVGTAFILVLAALRAGGEGSALTLGEFALYVYFLAFITDAVHFVGIYLARVRQVSVSIERMTALLGGATAAALVERHDLHLTGPEPAIPPPPPADDRLAVLAATGLTYRHPGSGKGVADASLRLERGTLTVVTGRIGAGKTTLLRALLGLLPPDEGTVTWNGRVIDDPAAFFVPPRSAYTPQVPRLFSLSLRDNLLLGLARSDDEVAAAIRSSVLERDLAAMPDGPATMVGPQGVRLSGGQVQRVAAARMLVRDADLLVFDDLSSALDVETERTLWQRLFDEGRVVTALVVSHRPAALARADQVLVMEDGAIVAEGTYHDLVAAGILERAVATSP
jgi:ATP-binding cassette subfamily B protein